MKNKNRQYSAGLLAHWGEKEPKKDCRKKQHDWHHFKSNSYLSLMLLFHKFHFDFA